jgi:hypothetical protein
MCCDLRVAPTCTCILCQSLSIEPPVNCLIGMFYSEKAIAILVALMGAIAWLELSLLLWLFGPMTRSLPHGFLNYHAGEASPGKCECP